MLFAEPPVPFIGSIFMADVRFEHAHFAYLGFHYCTFDMLDLIAFFYWDFSVKGHQRASFARINFATSSFSESSKKDLIILHIVFGCRSRRSFLIRGHETFFGYCTDGVYITGCEINVYDVFEKLFRKQI